MGREKNDPVGKLIRELETDNFELASVVGISTRWLAVIREGGARVLPLPLVQLVEKVLGGDRARQLERDYEAFRKALGEEALKKIEAKTLFPGTNSQHPGMFGE
jgi:hypothetical protein